MTSISDILQGYLYDSVKTLDGLDFFNKVVQFDNDPTNVASSDATFLFVGPPVLNPPKTWVSSPLTKDDFANNVQLTSGIHQFLRPLGAVQQYSLQQGRQVIPFNELGSRLKRHVVGSGQYSANLGRVLTRSMNLKASLYSWLPKFLAFTQNGSQSLALAVTPSIKYDAQNRPWEHFQWIGMESEIFDLPFGLLCLTGTSGGKFVHAEYLERCYMPNSSKGVSAGSAMIVENVNIMVTRPVPFATAQNEHLISKDVLLKKTKHDEFLLQEFVADPKK